MKRLSRVLISLMLPSLFILTSCGKDEIIIGNQGPDVEIKKCVRLSQKKKHENAIQCLEMFKARYPQSREGVEAELMIGDRGREVCLATAIGAGQEKPTAWVLCEHVGGLRNAAQVSMPLCIQIVPFHVKAGKGLFCVQPQAA